MTLALLPAFLIIKHLLITNVFDCEYSRARDNRNPRWLLSLFLWISTELTTSYILYTIAGLTGCQLLIVAEGLLCLLSTYFERNALLGEELRVYFFWEFFHFLFYIAIGFGT